MIINANQPPSVVDSVGNRQAVLGPETALLVESAQLFAGRKEIQIRHRGEVYRLRVTKNGKLILNK